MNTAAFLTSVEWNKNKPAIHVLLETYATKEIRIATQYRSIYERT
jgi:hypothetical protein